MVIDYNTLMMLAQQLTPAYGSFNPLNPTVGEQQQRERILKRAGGYQNRGGYTIPQLRQMVDNYSDVNPFFGATDLYNSLNSGLIK